MKKSIKKASEKKKGLKASMAIHAGLLLLALMPFMRQADSFNGEDLPNVEIAFVHADISSGSSSTAPKAIETPVEIPKVKVEVVEKKIEVIEPINREIIIEENTEAEVVIDENMSESSDEMAPETEVLTSTTDSDENEAEASSEGSASDSEAGEGDEGFNPTGKELGEMNFDGDGIFGRRVIYRADVKKITEKEGVVVVNLCVDRKGLVTHVAFNKENSTIHDADYVKKAMDVASDYLFEKDYSAPATQCGKLTFIFHIE